MLGSSAFTEETTTRQTSVAVVGDSDAYLTLEFPQHPVSFDCSTEVDVTVRNRTGQPLDELTVWFTLDPESVGSIGDSEVTLADDATLAAGNMTTVTVHLSGFTGHGIAELRFNVEASGGSVVIKTTSKRVIDLHYECSEEEGEGDDGDEDEDEGNSDEGKGDDGGEDGDDDEDKDNNEGNDDDDNKGGDSDDDSGDGDSED